MKILDPNLRDGVHEWRDGQRFVKEGDRLYLEGTDTLAGRYATVTLIFGCSPRSGSYCKCRNFGHLRP